MWRIRRRPNPLGTFTSTAITTTDLLVPARASLAAGVQNRRVGNESHEGARDGRRSATGTGSKGR